MAGVPNFRLIRIRVRVRVKVRRRHYKFKSTLALKALREMGLGEMGQNRGRDGRVISLVLMYNGHTHYLNMLGVANFGQGQERDLFLHLTVRLRGSPSL